MTKSTKALLWSALVFPGTGHLFLKYYFRGGALIALSLVSLWVLVVQATHQASAVLDKIQLDGGMLDLNSVSTLVARASQPSDNFSATIASIVLLGCWIIGMLDAYRLGKKKGE